MNFLDRLKKNREISKMAKKVLVPFFNSIGNDLKTNKSVKTEITKEVEDTILLIKESNKPKYKNYVSVFEELCKQKAIVAECNSITDFSTTEFIDNNEKKNIKLKLDLIFKNINTKKIFYQNLMIYGSLDDAIKSHNKEWMANHLDNPLFNDINGKSLDNEQRKSVLANELSTLVIAGAGSGKTLTICGKVKYLLEKKNIKPKEILLLSYSKKSADDLQKKVSSINENCTVGTFHKIGLDILKEINNTTYMVEDQYKAIIENYFRVEMKNRPHMLQTILNYYGLYISEYSRKKYNNEGEMFEDLKQQDFSTLKQELLSLSNNVNKRETLKKENVKSFEEMAIANWYFINGIEYKYESPYKLNTTSADKRQYMPDFYLPEYDIYHEHFGINKNGQASQYLGEEGNKYVESMNWKRQIHVANNTKCLETYSYEFEDGTVFEKLERELKARGVVFNPLGDEDIYNALESIYEGQAFKSFINLIRTFLSLYKAKYRDENGFDEFKKVKFENNYEAKRAKLFLSIVKDIYLYYKDYLLKEGKIDFDNMILQATDSLDKCNDFKYKYIIVDEFQDISFSRMIFLKKLLEHGNSKLFAVGDDWQAIYRFSGCDINILLKFRDYFGPSYITKITTTHRNSQELQNIAGPFVKANPEQINKSISSEKHLDYPIQIMYYNEKKYYAFLDVLKEITKKDNNANVLILGRNNKDIEDILLGNRIYIDFRDSNNEKTIVKVRDYPNMSLTFTTVHGSKGLEEDYVIIINADNSRLGFPNKLEDDKLLDLVQSARSNYEYAEERRLWYVALTRTRNYTYIIANNERPSQFVKEIEHKCLIINPSVEIDKSDEISCPYCKGGRLVTRTSDRDEKFYGCSNYPYCDYTINDFKAVKRGYRCPKCGDFLVYRTGAHGAFYGCYGYPKCKYTREYTPKKIGF